MNGVHILFTNGWASFNRLWAAERAKGRTNQYRKAFSNNLPDLSRFSLMPYRHPAKNPLREGGEGGGGGEMKYGIHEGRTVKEDCCGR